MRFGTLGSFSPQKVPTHEELSNQLTRASPAFFGQVEGLRIEQACIEVWIEIVVGNAKARADLLQLALGLEDVIAIAREIVLLILRGHGKDGEEDREFILAAEVSVLRKLLFDVRPPIVFPDCVDVVPIIE